MKWLTRGILVLTVLGVMAPAAALAADPAEVVEEAAKAEEALASVDAAKAGNWAIGLSSGMAAGLVILGAGYGIGKIGAAAVESMARQPEVAANIQTAMIISAALIEGVTFLALVIALLRLFV